MAAGAKNPFDLKERAAGPEAPTAARVWTEEEQAEKLAGYLEIPPEFWDQIRYGTHVRYFSKREGFRTGGFVLRNPLDERPPSGSEVKRYMQLQNGFNSKVRGYAVWKVAYEDAARFLIKPDAGVLVAMRALADAVKALNANIQKVAAHTKKLEERLAELERRE